MYIAGDRLVASPWCWASKRDLTNPAPAKWPHFMNTAGGGCRWLNGRWHYIAEVPLWLWCINRTDLQGIRFLPLFSSFWVAGVIGEGRSSLGVTHLFQPLQESVTRDVKPGMFLSGQWLCPQSITTSSYWCCQNRGYLQPVEHREAAKHPTKHKSNYHNEKLCIWPQKATVLLLGNCLWNDLWTLIPFPNSRASGSGWSPELGSTHSKIAYHSDWHRATHPKTKLIFFFKAACYYGIFLADVIH